MTNRDLFIFKKDTEAKADKRTCTQAILMKKGDIVQFRFNSPKHFRTLNEEYFSVSDEVWKESVLNVGSVWEKIVWSNKAKLQEIMDLGLYDQTNEEKEIITKLTDNTK